MTNTKRSPDILLRLRSIASIASTIEQRLLDHNIDNLEEACVRLCERIQDHCDFYLNPPLVEKRYRRLQDIYKYRGWHYHDITTADEEEIEREE